MKIKKGAFMLVAFLLLQDRGLSATVQQQCYHCVDGDCTKTQDCEADNTQCLENTWKVGDKTVGKGCFEKCDATTVTRKISTFTDTPKCCGTDLCNGVNRVAGPSVVAVLSVALFSLLFF